MSGIVTNRRAAIEAAAGSLVAVGLPAAALADVAPMAGLVTSARMIAAWVILRPGAGAAVRLAFLDGGGRLLGELPTVRIEAGCGRAASLWRQAQEAHAVAQALVVVALASAWAVPSGECAIRPGLIAHPRSGRAMKHAVWVDVA